MRKRYIIIFVLIVFIILAGIGIWYFTKEEEEQSYQLGKGIVIESVSEYTGEFLEDGSDQNVKNVWALTVKNTSEQDVQYLKILAAGEDETAEFEITVLPAGSTVRVLESNQKEFSENAEKTDYKVENLAYFNEERSLYTEKFKTSTAENWIRIENISEEDVTNDIYVYYKSMEDDMFLGGITYRTKFSGGLKAGETKEVETKHYDLEKSQIMYITYQ